MAHVSYLVFFILSYLLLLSLAQEERMIKTNCSSFSCGELHNIRFPFTNRTHPECGYCVVSDCDKPTQKIQLGKDEPWYYITSISQDGTVALYDQVFQNHLNNRSCESFKNMTLSSFSPFVYFKILSNLTMFKCRPSLDNVPTKFNASCDDFMIYYNHPNDTDLPNLPPHCSRIQLPVNKTGDTTDLFHLLTGNFSLKVIPNWRATRGCRNCLGREGQCLRDSGGSFHCSNGITGVQSPGGHCRRESKGKFHCSETRECNDCFRKRGRCSIDSKGSFQCENIGTEDGNLKLKLGLGLGTSAAAGFCILIIIGICFSKKFSSHYSIILWKKKTENCQSIGAFLGNYGSTALKRYSYSDIKKMTDSCKHKIGQGGYGSVYKGKLLDGRNVAVKVLNETKGNGEDFINEVASISRTSHVNIVTLLGFCFEGHRRALVYEFASNGSLDKFIYKNSSPEANRRLKWETLYKIALGIARGLEYLHRGCNTRILHFDIKPHNILIDENFCPKIADFGLAKICHMKESIVSMSCARGTIGYIAPEVFYRNIGEVSYKSDAYSYGMMVLEMTRERNNIDVGVNAGSDIYFPHLIHKRLETDEELGLQGIENEEDKEYARKMIIVSLWCIEISPSNRPTMSRVVNMLEGSLDSLQIPPKPFLFSSGSTADSSTIQSMPTL